MTEVGFGATTGTVGSALSGAYGALTLNADGSYSYALDNSDPRVNALRDGETLTEVFTYRITDADGDESTATLTITITGRTDGTTQIVPGDMNGAAHGENSVSERGLGDAGDASETTTGTVTVTAPDGLSTVTVGGRVITLAELQALGTSPITVTTPKGILTITGFTPGTTVGGVPIEGDLSYSYELTTLQDHSGGAVDDVFALEVGDAGGGSATGTLTIAIADAVPQAQDDTATIAEDDASDTVDGNVFSGVGPGDVADSAGNDGPATGGPVTGVGFGTTSGTVGSGLSGAYGTLTLNADGSYSYLLDNGNAAVNGLRDGQTLTEVFSYRISDADGSTSEATLTITI
ncbi:VCBS domain-containing protein, partial [Bosea sp. WAO]|uniref:VCBS domain-containing protein n=1 Tax=Bosea sp. WAO TaxID=406341 RepID=UPI0018DAFD04